MTSHIGLDLGNEYNTLEMMQKIENVTGYRVGQSLYSEFPFMKTGYLVAKKEPKNEAGEPDIQTPMIIFISTLHRYFLKYFLLDDYVNGRLYLLFAYRPVKNNVRDRECVLLKALHVVLTEMEKLYPTENFFTVIQQSACMSVFTRNMSRNTIVLPAGFFHLQNIEKVTGHRVSFEEHMFPFQCTGIFSLMYVVGTEDGENYIQTAIAKFISTMDRHGIGYVVVDDHVYSKLYLHIDRKAVDEVSIVQKDGYAALQATRLTEGNTYHFGEPYGMRERLKYWSPEARVLSPAGFAHLKEMEDTNPLLLVSRLWASPTQTSLD